jgi:hypothetical protein
LILGRELFESNADLVTSDAQFQEEGEGETVAVDWTLFSQELDETLDGLEEGETGKEEVN